MKLVLLIQMLILGASFAQGQEKNWTDMVKVSGDLRFRSENINEEDDEERFRQRIRGRLGIEGQVNDSMDLIFRLATGEIKDDSENADERSTNQTLGDSGSNKPFSLDLAYLSWRPVEGLGVFAGKMKNPFFSPGKSEMIWDGDLTPEGLAADYRKKWENFSVFVVGAELWLRESGSGQDLKMQGLELGVRTDRETWGGTLGLGYLMVPETQEEVALNNHSDGNGNTVTVSGSDYLYATGFEVVQAFAEADLKWRIPVLIYAQYVLNQGEDADEEDLNTGYLFGFRLGKSKEVGDWSLDINTREVKANALVGALSDGDFGGGGTDVAGQRVSLGYLMAKNGEVKLTHFLSEKNHDDLTGSDSLDYERTQLDFLFNF